MKLFGGGKPNGSSRQDEARRDDEAGYFDSPTENVSLAAPTPRRESSVVVEEPPATLAYGIDAAIALMRSLPLDQNPQLVVTVIKTTLESLRVKVPEIIADASRKQADLERRVEMLTKEITDYEKEIAHRKDEISRLEADHRETTSVKERLELAERSASDTKSSKPPQAQGQVKT